MSVDEEVETVLNGEGLPVKEYDSAPDRLKPVVLRQTICYIVCAVIFNSKNEVLMVQEAKPDCYKQWYLPAGRMEVGESIEEAMRREVKEEAGLECQPITLLLVQEQGPQWVRFAFLAEATGGSLKTEAESDAESLQAQWWDREAPLTLRGQDINRLIAEGLKYREKAWFPPARPIDLSCRVVVQRVVLAFSNPDKELWLLVGTTRNHHLPVAVSVKTHTMTWAANKLVQEAMPASYYQLELHTWGILGLQHSGRVPGKTDGLCFNMLASLEHEGPEGPHTSLPPALESSRYLWHKVENQLLREKILHRIKSVDLLPVHSLF